MAQENDMEIIYLAAAAEYGLVVAVSDFHPALQALYRARAKLKDADIPELSFHQSPINENEIWIAKVSKVKANAKA